jgi:S-adenosylmethionine/arginine decarboxylase-like enzyme
VATEHTHLIIRALVSKPPTDPEIASNWLQALVPAIGMKTLLGPYATYCSVPGNAGLTAAVIIETSHIVLHCWDESSPAELQFDVYTCSSLNTETIFDALQQFDPTSIEYKILDRTTNLTIVRET